MIDPVTLAVIRGRLEQIVDEMDATLFRAAFSPVMAKAHDGSHGLYDAVTGDAIAMGKTGLPVFIGAMSHAARAAIKRAEADGGFEDGEREVWIDGGWQTTRIYDRPAPPAGGRVAGPAILEQSDTTIFVDPGLGAESTNSAT